MSAAAEVVLWGKVIGAVAWDAARDVAAFEFTPEFQKSGIELAPLTMPLGKQIFSFPNLNHDSFHGLPGMLADALPDKFGNLLIDQWLARTGRDANSFSPVERLCYIGARGMGALEFRPALREKEDVSRTLEIDSLIALANEALQEKESLTTKLTGNDQPDQDAIQSILQVGTSAGGARAKAVVAWDESTGAIRTGQTKAPEGFTYWLMKFDGVTGNRDKELADPQGYGKIEYAYHLMAKAAGIEMTDCRLHHENERSHFMTRRFDRTDDGKKIFMQSLCAMNHMDFNQAGAYSYEQAMVVAHKIGLSVPSIRELFRRMAFNVMARNQDDHTKNIAFLMNKDAEWKLSPAFDVTYSYNPQGAWTSRHQMTVNGKRDDFTRSDFTEFAANLSIGRKPIVQSILESIDAALERWPEFAERAGVPENLSTEIAKHHRRLAALSKS